MRFGSTPLFVVAGLFAVITAVAGVYALGSRHSTIKSERDQSIEHIETLERIDNALDKSDDLPWHERLQLERGGR